MTCSCGYEFCWHCSAPWALCRQTNPFCFGFMVFKTAPFLYLARLIIRRVPALAATADFIWWLTTPVSWCMEVLSYVLSYAWSVALSCVSLCWWLLSGLLGLPMRVCTIVLP